MQLVLRAFAAFCVATVVAQAIILGLSAFKGNLQGDVFLKGVALLNGIDISGEQLQRMFQDAKNTPNPTYEEVEEKRARMDRDLDMRERAIQITNEQLLAMKAELQTKETIFEQRVSDFYNLLDKKKQEILTESLEEVKRTIEALSPDQAKDQLMRMINAGHLDDVVAIFKGMAADKRKKIMGEFINESIDEAKDEPGQLHNILMRLLEGEPAVGVIDQAREAPAPTQTQ